MAEFGLQLRLAQKLALSPQLQQAIRLLQMTRIELREHIQQTVDANPLLEYDEGGGSGEEQDWESGTASEERSAESSEESGDAWEREGGDDFGADQDDWSRELGLGDQWNEGRSGDGDRELQVADPGTGGLREHLLFQISLGHFTEADAAIATAIVFALDEDGFLADSPEEIRASLAPELLVEPEEIEAVRHRVQRMEPVGVASLDPVESINVQLGSLPGSTPGLELARRIARSYIDLLADRNLEELARLTGAAAEALEQALALIRSLEARPGARYDNRRDEYLVPDVYVRQVEGQWQVYLSPDNDPRLRLNRYYISLLRQAGGENRDYLNGRLQEARWLLSSLELRNRTLLSVAQGIVDVQQDFMAQGDLGMRPLILKDIAERVGVHESTVSRATTRKYLLTPRGLYELKYFFSSSVGTQGGGNISSTAVKARLQTLIANEPQARPLSDQELSRLLGEMGIDAARRTVAKYRESLGIGSSGERRRAYRRLAGRQRRRSG